MVAPPTFRRLISIERYAEDVGARLATEAHDFVGGSVQ